MIEKTCAGISTYNLIGTSMTSRSTQAGDQPSLDLAYIRPGGGRTLHRVEGSRRSAKAAGDPPGEGGGNAHESLPDRRATGVFRCKICGADFAVKAPWDQPCPDCGRFAIEEGWSGPLPPGVVLG